MTKIKKLIWQRNIGLVILCLVAVVGVGLGIRAYTSEVPPQTVMEKVTMNIENFNEAPEVPINEELEFGSLTSPDIISRYLSVNGDTTYHIGGDLKDATTTIVSFVNPFLRATSSSADVVIPGTTNNGFGLTGATTTVDLIRINITGAATTTYSISCGSSAGPTNDDAVSLLDTAALDLATTSVGMVENNLTAALGGLVDAGTVEKITLNATYPYFVCNVTTNLSGAFTEVTNTFDGKFTAHVHKQR